MPDTLSTDELLKRLLAEVEPELKHMRGEHDRIMKLIARKPEPTEAEKQEIRKTISPTGWRAAIDDVRGKLRKRKYKSYLLLPLVTMLIGIALGVIVFLLL